MAGISMRAARGMDDRYDRMAACGGSVKRDPPYDSVTVTMPESFAAKVAPPGAG